MIPSQEPGPLPVAEAMTPPLPHWAYGVVNPIMSFLLRSPLHGLLSGSLMLLVYEGRKSGKRYSIPVGYMRAGDRLLVFSHAGWAKNFVGGGPVALRLRGELRPATASLVSDPVTIAEAVRKFVANQGEQMATRMGFLGPGPDGATRMQMPHGTSLVQIDLQ